MKPNTYTIRGKEEGNVVRLPIATRAAPDDEIRRAVGEMSGLDLDEADEDGVPVRTLFIASTDDVDRYDDIVDQANWQFEGFGSNPVIPWGHDYYPPPVGRGEFYGVVQNKLVIVVGWDMKDEYARGIARRYHERFLNAGSVGFRPGRAIRRSQLPKDDPRYKEGGWGAVYYDNELLEFSAVVIPANRHALAQREVEDLVAKGLRPESFPMDDAARRALEARELGEAIRPVLRQVLTEEAEAMAPRLRALVEGIADEVVTETLARGLEAQADAEEAGLWEAIADAAPEEEPEDDGWAELVGEA